MTKLSAWTSYFTFLFFLEGSSKFKFVKYCKRLKLFFVIPCSTSYNFSRRVLKRGSQTIKISVEETPFRFPQAKIFSQFFTVKLKIFVRNTCIIFHFPVSLLEKGCKS